MTPNTHPRISEALVGAVVELSEGRAVARLTATGVMAADERGLTHGGFTFGLADYAAILAPVTTGQTMVARAEITQTKGKKRVVDATVEVDGKAVFTGTLTCFVLEQHVLAG